MNSLTNNSEAGCKQIPVWRILAVALTIALTSFDRTSAAVVVGDYTFDGNLNNSAGGGFAMSFTGGGSFGSDTPFGEASSVLNLGGTQGLQINTAGLTSQAAYTLIMDINTVEVNSYNALVHVDTSDDLGLYILNEDIYYYPVSDLQSTNDFVQADAWHRFALTRASDGTVHLYGSEAGTDFVSLRASGSDPDAESIAGNSIQLFKDNNTSENYNLSVSRVLLGDGAMTLEEINSYSSSGSPSPTSSAIPEPSTLALSVLALGLLRLVKRHH
jgi:hypothetical protein